MDWNKFQQHIEKQKIKNENLKTLVSKLKLSQVLVNKEETKKMKL